VGQPGKRVVRGVHERTLYRNLEKKKRKHNLPLEELQDKNPLYRLSTYSPTREGERTKVKKNKDKNGRGESNTLKFSLSRRNNLIASSESHHPSR